MLQRLDMTQLCSLLIFSLNKKNWKMVPICNVELAAVRKKGADVCGWVLWGSPCWQVIRQNTSLLHFPKHIINQRDISGCSHCCSQWSNISRNVMVDLRVWKIQVEVNWTPYTICAYEKDKKSIYATFFIYTFDYLQKSHCDITGIIMRREKNQEPDTFCQACSHTSKVEEKQL